jgi:hypothetical protein
MYLLQVRSGNIIHHSTTHRDVWDGSWIGFDKTESFSITSQPVDVLVTPKLGEQLLMDEKALWVYQYGGVLLA